MKHNKYATKRNVMFSIIAVLISFVHIHAQECDTLIQIKNGYKTSLIDMRPGTFNAQLANTISREAFNSVIDDLGVLADTNASIMVIDTATLHYDTFAPELQAEWNEFIEICKESALDDIQMGNIKNWIYELWQEMLFRTYEAGNHGIAWIIPISDGTVNGKKVTAITRKWYNKEKYEELHSKILSGELTRENAIKFNLYDMYQALAVTYYNFGEKYDQFIASGSDKDNIDSFWGLVFVHETGNNTFGLVDSPIGNNDYMDPVTSTSGVQYYKDNHNGEAFTDMHRSQMNAQLISQSIIEKQTETSIDHTADASAMNALETKLDTLQSAETILLSTADLTLYTYTDCANEQVNANPTLELDIPSPHTVVKVGDNYEITAGAISGIETVAMTIKTTMDSSTDSDNPNRITRDTTINIVIVGSTSVDEQSSDNLNIYPNPTSHYLTIESDSYNRYQLISTQGIMLKSGKLTNKANIDLSKFSTGIYIIALQDRTTGKYIHRKVVKR